RCSARPFDVPFAAPYSARLTGTPRRPGPRLSESETLTNEPPVAVHALCVAGPCRSTGEAFTRDELIAALRAWDADATDSETRTRLVHHRPAPGVPLTEGSHPGWAALEEGDPQVPMRSGDRPRPWKGGPAA